MGELKFTASLDLKKMQAQLGSMLKGKLTGTSGSGGTAQGSKKQENSLALIASRLVPLAVLWSLKPVADILKVIEGFIVIGIMKILEFIKFMTGAMDLQTAALETIGSWIGSALADFGLWLAQFILVKIPDFGIWLKQFILSPISDFGTWLKQFIKNPIENFKDFILEALGLKKKPETTFGGGGSFGGGGAGGTWTPTTGVEKAAAASGLIFPNMPSSYGISASGALPASQSVSTMSKTLNFYGVTPQEILDVINRETAVGVNSYGR
jgi:hypothetical protein